MENSDKTDYLIYGAGAIGSVIGGLLALSGKKVLFHGRGRHFEKMTSEGLKIDGLWGERHLPPLCPLDPAKKASFRNIFLTVKAHQTEKAVEELRPLADDDTLVFSMQNGLGNIETITAAFGESRAVGGRVIFGAAIIEPGLARVTVYADRILVGFSRKTEVSPRLIEVAYDLTGAGIPAEAVADILPAVWAKALYNCCLNPLGAILDVNYGRLGENKGTRRFMREIIEEIYRVARAHRVNLVPPEPEQYYNLLLEKLLPPTASHLSSMLQDLKNGRHTEIEALCGQIVRMGDEAGISTPYNQALTWMVKFMEENASCS